VTQGRRDEPGSWTRGRFSDRFRERVFGRERDRDVEIDRERERPRWQDGSMTAARPLVRPAPRSAMFFPLVVIVAVLPGLYALNSWDLTPPGPWWGLRALSVLDGWVIDQIPAAEAIRPSLESWTVRTVSGQPPLYAWLSAAGLAVSSDRDPLAAVLPSYAAGAVVVILVYLNGRLWRGPGVGLTAAVLTGFNRNLLIQMQEATPTTLALAGALFSLYAYGRFARAATASGGGPLGWAALSGLGLGISLMAVGLFGLAVVPVVALHQLFLRAGAVAAPGAGLNFGFGLGAGRDRGRPWWRSWWPLAPGLRAGGLSLGVALAVALPWHAHVIHRHGSDVIAALLAPLDPVSGPRTGLLERMVQLAPATLALGLFAAARTVRQALADETDDRATVGGVLWVFWLAVAALVPAFWPAGPWHLGGLFLLVPLNLLAAQAISDLAGRRVPVRTLNWLAPATAAAVAWCFSANLRGAVADVAHGRADSATALGLHLALDLMLAAVWLTHRIERWARRRDDRQRRVLAGYLLAVMVVTVAAGGREVWFRHRETDDLLMLRTMILRRDRERPFDLVAVVGPEAFRVTPDGPVPGGRLRFILRTALPGLPQRDLSTTDELAALADELSTRPDAQRLVVLVGAEQRLRPDVQSRLKLEAIHPGRTGVLDAFATASGDGNRSKKRE